MGFAESTLVGEAFVGEGANAAHISAILGRKGGPVETAWLGDGARRPAHGTLFVRRRGRPGVPMLPFTPFANKVAPDSETPGEMTWGPAQAGVAAGRAGAVEEALIPASETRNLLCIATVWVNPKANDADVVYEHNRTAAHEAIRAAVAEIPAVETDEGVTGIDSGDTMDGFAGHEHLFVGEDPTRVARHVRVLETISFHAGRY